MQPFITLKISYLGVPFYIFFCLIMRELFNLIVHSETLFYKVTMNISSPPCPILPEGAIYLTNITHLRNNETSSAHSIDSAEELLNSVLAFLVMKF